MADVLGRGSVGEGKGWAGCHRGSPKETALKGPKDANLNDDARGEPNQQVRRLPGRSVRPYRGGALREGHRPPREVQDRTRALRTGDTGVGVRQLIPFAPSLNIGTARRWTVGRDAEKVGGFGSRSFRVSEESTASKRKEHLILEYAQRRLSCVVGGRAATATPGRTNEGRGILGRGIERSGVRDKDELQVGAYRTQGV